MSTILKNIIVIVCLIVVGVVGYTVFLNGDSTEKEFDDAQVDSEIAIRTEKILADTQEVNDYKLDTSIFTDSRFRSLKDFTVHIEDVSTGRTNPFVPVR